MLPYFLLLGVSLAGGLPPVRRRIDDRKFLFATGVLYWLLASFRYVTGFDYRFYESVFQSTAEAGWSAHGTLPGIEPGYLLLNLAVGRLGGDYRTFLLLFHLLLTVTLFLWIGRYSRTPWLSVSLFLSLQYFALSMNFHRQALAAVILLWCYPFLQARRLPACCGIILFAACFHRTALIMLPLCALFCLRPSRLHYALAALAAGCVHLLMDPLASAIVEIVPKYQHYLTEKYWRGNSLLYLLLPVGCFLFALPMLRRTRQDLSSPPVLINSLYYSLLLQTLITRHFILERLSIYASFFALLALPEAARLPGRLSPRTRTGLLIAGCFVYFLFAASQGFHGVYPFPGIWNRAATV